MGCRSVEENYLPHIHITWTGLIYTDELSQVFESKARIFLPVDAVQFFEKKMVKSITFTHFSFFILAALLTRLTDRQTPTLRICPQIN